MLAITGTNGKTTTAYLAAAALRSADRHVGVIGTIGFTLDDRPLEMARTTVTTPESPELQALLGLLVEEGADTCVLEVSSHALVLGRVDAITFDVAAFTTLGDDHLDFHGDMESYFAAKATLFTPEHTRHAVVNVDDPYGRRLVESIRGAGAVGCSTISLGASGQADQRLTGPADYIATVVEETVGQPTRVRLDCPGRTLEFGLGLPGDFNVRNAATALAMLDVVGVDLDAAGAGLPQAQVPGRLQRVALGPGAPSVYVDFAHTPQAVTAALGAVAGRRVVVLGCGGDRDRHKRAPMGAAAAGAAAVVVVTDDNPRSEDPAAIRAEVLRGAHEAVRDAELNCVVIDGGDRRSAIGTALRHAGPEDVVVILGKGHESGQEVHGQVLPFSDPTVVAEEWAALRAQVGPT
jgi:UDP-N-acetylmuramoyl-L-alanyl-D-glutamate--2,6-diaminopimelate ligase